MSEAPDAASGSGEHPSPPASSAGAGRPVQVVVEPRTVAATRAILASLAQHPGRLPVVGWADLSAPNLVDLLDDLMSGPGGRHLAGIAAPSPPAGHGWLDDVAVRRGLACLQRSGLSLRLLGPVPPALLARLAAEEPTLAVLVDEPGAGTTAGAVELTH